MTRAQRKQGKKTIHSWKGARPLLEQWREDLRTLTVEVKQPRVWLANYYSQKIPLWLPKTPADLRISKTRQRRVTCYLHEFRLVHPKGSLSFLVETAYAIIADHRCLRLKFQSCVVEKKSDEFALSFDSRLVEEGCAVFLSSAMRFQWTTWGSKRFNLSTQANSRSFRIWRNAPRARTES